MMRLELEVPSIIIFIMALLQYKLNHKADGIGRPQEGDGKEKSPAAT
jgi:hypothetical protein